MKKLLTASLLTLIGVSLFTPSIVEAARVRVVGPRHRVVVVTGHPIHRTLHEVVVRRPAVVVRVAPARFLPVVIWRPVVVVRPAADVLAWQDLETFDREENWSETLFDSDQRGRKLYLEVVSGRVQFDFAEVVFENGECQVVDFAEKTHDKGFYSLLDFKDGRKVDHVRLVARARSNEAKIALVMEK